MQSKSQELKDIADEIKDCPICKKNATGLPVIGEGDVDAKVIFVGEAPGKKEAETGRPFIGRSGQLLRETIRNSGFTEKEVYITSPVKYLPIYKTPKPADIAHAKIHFDKQVAIIDPEIVVLLGSVAAQAVLGEKISVLKEHGRYFKKQKRIYFLTIHPAAALRSPLWKRIFLEDFLSLKHLVDK